MFERAHNKELGEIIESFLLSSKHFAMGLENTNSLSIFSTVLSTDHEWS
jgi:hypothetical protein